MRIALTIRLRRKRSATSSVVGSVTLSLKTVNPDIDLIKSCSGLIRENSANELTVDCRHGVPPKDGVQGKWFNQLWLADELRDLTQSFVNSDFDKETTEATFVRADDGMWDRQASHARRTSSSLIRMADDVVASATSAAPSPVNEEEMDNAEANLPF